MWIDRTLLGYRAYSPFWGGVSMSTQEYKRKLTTILSADVVGYSRLMGDDESATVKTLEHYKAIMSDLIRQHRGRVVDSPGDNLLAEFTSVVDAVQCAVATQKEFQAQNADLPEHRRMQFRIGINLGDVIEEDGRIYGDGVNIAARLESLADPGGVCISKTAFDQIETKLPLGYQYIGEQTVKNITKPVKSYKVVMEPRVTGVDRKELAKGAPILRRKSVLSGAVAVLILIIGAGVWNFYWRTPKIEPASKEKMAFPLPDKPSIAVMPFINMSEDPKQEFLCDGISDEIITALSKVPRLFVVARNSTFTYKGKPVKVKQVSEELGVHYVLEGSVQKSSDRIRINAQLINALSGDHLWADSYDRELKDIFVLQDEITMKVLTSVQDKLTLGTEVLRSQKNAEKYFRGQQGLDCYLKIMEGNNYVEHRNIKDNNLAQRIADEVLIKCSDIPMAYILMANVHFLNYFLGLANPQESIDKGIEMAVKAISMDDTLAEAHGILGGLYTQNREYDKGIAEGERAVTGL
jgi:adenylate cyclase